MNLNPVVPGIFHFTTINIASGSTLKFNENVYHGAVYFLAAGDVSISGVMDLSGDDSYGAVSFASQRIPNVGASLKFGAGSGGYAGGIGGQNNATNPPLKGNGPGGGDPPTAAQGGVATGGVNTSNQFLVPLFGGSGGGGGTNGGTFGPIGGHGGGALFIASSTTITMSGSINAKGGSGSTYGGGGAGGAVRLVANNITGNGSVNVAGAAGCGCGQNPSSAGGNGLARFESNNAGGFSVNGPQTRSTPFALNLPTVALPSVRVTAINGQPINANPFSFPDININTTSQVPITIQATNVPIATAVVKIYVFSETGADQVIPIGPLTGTDASSTATANITYQPGGSRGYVKATW
jgi:hypothetical protein